ncbi:MAG: leucine-rich repeat protein [Clostridia bacterium]|nr:leucine-rich repeat protein [Clostridia bacterium]
MKKFPVLPLMKILIFALILSLSFLTVSCDTDGTSDTDADEVCLHISRTEKTVNPGNCTQRCVTELVCDKCGDIEQRVGDTVPDGHSYGAWSVLKPSDCSEKGKQSRVCSLCGKTETEDIATDPEAHSYGAWQVLEHPTCISDGERKRLCSDCGASESEVLPPDPDAHNTVLSEKKATCVSVGERVNACSYCNYSDTAVLPIDPDNHSFDSEKYSVSIDSHALICDRCGVTGASEAHTGENKLYGNTLGHYLKCGVCDGEYSHGGHDYRTVTTQPTYKEEGSQHEVCDDCGYETEPQVLDKLPQVEPAYSIPAPIRCTYGMRLSDIALPEGFAFVSSLDCSVGNAGENLHLATYTVPNDTEGKYLTVYGIEITLDVKPMSIVIPCDFSRLANLVYRGEQAPSPDVASEYAHLVRIEWYIGDTLLSSAPVNAGEYTVAVVCADANYAAESSRFEFVIKKASCPVTQADVTDSVYTGEPVLFVFPDTVTDAVFKNSGGTVISPPIDTGDYFITVTVAETQNYEGGVLTFEFSILKDTEAPMWDQDYLTINSDSEKYLLSARDNAKIAYYSVFVQSTAYSAPEQYITVSDSIDVKMGHSYIIYAHDVSGNQSSELYLVVQPESADSVENIHPANGATVDGCSVTLYAPDATGYYFGYTPDRAQMISLYNGRVSSLDSGVTYYWYATWGELESPVYSFSAEYGEEVALTLISPADGAVITDKHPGLYAEGSNGCRIFYVKLSGTNTEYELQSDSVFTYGATYKWYAEDNDGNRSEERTFTYLYNNTQSEPLLRINANAEVNYVSTPYLNLSAFAICPIDSIVYYTSSMDGVLSSETHLEPICIGNYAYATARTYYLKNGDTVYVYARSGDFISSGVKTFVIDTEAPVCGEIAQSGRTVKLYPGSDNLEARYYYSIDGGIWKEYSKEVELYCENDQMLICVRAVDLAGNESGNSLFIDLSGHQTPAIEAIGGAVNSLVKTDVTLKLTPIDGIACYYYVDGERYSLDDGLELVFSEEGTKQLWTSAVYNGVESLSEPVRIMIDKTAPVIGELICRADSVNNFSSPNYLMIAPGGITDANNVTVSYRIPEVSEDIKPYDEYGCVPLFNYLINISQVLEIEIIAVDEAGNRTVKTASVIYDVEGPTAESVVLDRTPDAEAQTTRYTVKVKGIADVGGGRYASILFRIWDQSGYENGGDPIVDIQRNVADGENEFVYDASHLPYGANYHFIVLLTDGLGNGTRYYYTFYKYDILTTVQKDGFLFELIDGQYVLFKYMGEDTALVLPESVNGSGYVIGSSFMYGNTDITSVVIPEGVTEIRGQAFSGCESLNYVSVPSTVKKIGTEAFYNCSALQEIKLEAELDEFGDHAFYGAPYSSIEGITLYENGYYLGSTKHPYQVLLTVVKGAIELKIHSDTVFIAAEACMEASALTSVSVPSGVTRIPYACFAACGQLKEITLREGLRYIGEFAFFDCYSLKSVGLPDSLEVIGERAFSGCVAITSLTVKEKVSEIGDMAFYGCIGIKELSINSLSLSLGGMVFDNCRGVESLYYNAVEALCHSSGYQFASLGTDGTGVRLIIGNKVISIPDAIFRNANITELVFEEKSSCVAIGNYAFRGCNITSVALPDSLKALGHSVFLECDLLETLIIPDGIQSVGGIGRDFEYLRYNVKDNGLYLGNESSPYLVLVAVDLDAVEFTVSDETSLICPQAFLQCEFLSEITISESVTFIGEFAFSNPSRIYFADADGWTIDGQLISPTLLSDAESAATELRFSASALVKSSD